MDVRDYVLVRACFRGEYAILDVKAAYSGDFHSGYGI